MKCFIEGRSHNREAMPLAACTRLPRCLLSGPHLHHTAQTALSSMSPGIDRHGTHALLGKGCLCKTLFCIDDLDLQGMSPWDAYQERVACGSEQTKTRLLLS